MPLDRKDIEPALLRRLEPRIGLYHLRQRLELERDRFDAFSRKPLADRLHLGRVVSQLARISGLQARGERNALSPQVTLNRVVSPSLPPAFDGYRVLHLTDLHLDGKFDLIPVIEASIGHLDYDVCLLTGDYRCGLSDSRRLQEQMISLRELIRGEAVAVLGNHDSLTMVPWMEDAGFRVLLNESIQVERDEAAIDLVGVDDYHYFRCSDIEKALREARSGFVVMLNHSPEQFRQAAYAGVDLYLCGHTHGGQICLPGGSPLSLNLHCTRKVGAGAWLFRDMHGYTSRGVGTSVAQLRFNCPPEIVVHELVRASRD